MWNFGGVGILARNTSNAEGSSHTHPKGCARSRTPAHSPLWHFSASTFVPAATILCSTLI